MLQLTSSRCDLTGRTAIVTGAARGIGQAIALALATEGADIAAVDVLDTAETVAKVTALGRQAAGFQVDVRDRAAVQAFTDEVIRTFGKVDILVNSAGTCVRTTIEDLTEEQWDQDMDIGAKGTFFCIQAVYPHMKERGYGKIVNISSLSGEAGGAVSRAGESQEARGSRTGPGYAATKGAIIALTKWVAKDGGQFGIYCNSVAPGPVATEMTRGFDYGVDSFPIPRMGTAEDIAQAVVFLASDMSNYVTGHILDVNGGCFMR